MPSFTLEGAAQVILSEGALTLYVQISQPSPIAAPSATLSASVADSAAEVGIRPRPGMIVLPRVDGSIIVSVHSMNLQPFAAGTVAHLSIVVDEGRQDDPERVVVAGVDVSGVASRALVILAPHGNGATVSNVMTTVAPDDLGALGNAARAAVIEVLGVHNLQASGSVAISVVVDGSASFAPLLADGSALALVDVLAGVAEVVAADREVTFAVVGADLMHSERVAPGALGAAVQAASTRPTATGLRSALPAVGLAHLLNGPRSITYLITDAVPADLPEFDRVNERHGEARHLVVIGTAAAFKLQLSRGGPMTLAPITLFDPGVVTGPAGLELSAQLAADPSRLKALVSALLVGYFAVNDLRGERVFS